MVQIVTVNVSQQVAPTPSTLQRSGALISQGGTINSPNTLSLLTQLSDLAPILSGSHANTSLSWSGNVVTVTAASPHGLTVGDTVEITIAGVTASGYNGTYMCNITGTSTFTYPLSPNPGSASIPGVYTIEDVAELNAMATTLFAQGSGVSVWVLELGAGNAADGAAALGTWITTNPNTIYSFLVPRYWDGDSAFLSLIAQYEALTAKTYFFVTTSLRNYTKYTSLMKDVISEVEAPQLGTYPRNALTSAAYTTGIITFGTTTNHGVSPGDWVNIAGCSPAGYNGWFLAIAPTSPTSTTLIVSDQTDPGANTVLGSLVASQVTEDAVPPSEFSIAATFYDTLAYNPSPANRVAPLAFKYQFDVTSFPEQGLSALRQTLQDAKVNFVNTGAEGGITNTILWRGTTMDGRDFTYWYSVDYAQINGKLDVANEVINGSNTDINPLYYDQPGINRLQDRLAITMARCVAVGLATGKIVKTTFASGQDFANALETGQYAGQIVVNAIPFPSYAALFPDDYMNEKYNGLSVQYIPNRGFREIVFNIDVTDFVAGAP